MQSPSFQVKKFKLHRIFSVPSGQVVEGFTILPSSESISIKRIVCLCSFSVSVCLSRCIRTVFKLRSSSFTGLSTNPRDRSWRGSRSHPTPEGSEIKGSSLKKRNFDVQSPVFNLRSSISTKSSMSRRDRSWRGLRFYPTLERSEIKV